MTVYADVLISLNIIIDYFLISLTTLFLKTDCKFIRQLAAAGVGGVCSLFILLPFDGILPNIGYRLITSILIVLTAYGVGKMWLFLKRIVIFYITSAVFSGMIFAVAEFIKPHGLSVHNGVIYYHLSSLVLVTVTAACYGILTLTDRFLKRNSEDVCRIKIKEGTTEINLIALIDSGNKLREPFSEKPVILLDGKYSHHLKCGKKPQRIIPYKTVSGEGILYGFIPDEILLCDGHGEVKLDMYVSFSPTPLENKYGAVVGLD